MNADLRLRAVLALTVAGTLVSGYLLALRYRLTSAGFCEVGTFFSCEAVNASPYATLLGVPVAAVGLAGFLALFVLQFAGASGSSWMPPRRANRWTLRLAAAGVLFGSYLTYVEVAVLQTVCLLCVAAFALGVAVLLLAAQAVAADRRVTRAAG